MENNIVAEFIQRNLDIFAANNNTEMDENVHFLNDGFDKIVSNKGFHHWYGVIWYYTTDNYVYSYNILYLFSFLISSIYVYQLDISIYSYNSLLDMRLGTDMWLVFSFLYLSPLYDYIFPLYDKKIDAYLNINYPPYSNRVSLREVISEIFIIIGAMLIIDRFKKR